MLGIGFRLKMELNQQRQLVSSERKQKFLFLGILQRDIRQTDLQNCLDSNGNIASASMKIDLMKIEILEKTFNGIIEKFMNHPIFWLVSDVTKL